MYLKSQEIVVRQFLIAEQDRQLYVLAMLKNGLFIFDIHNYFLTGNEISEFKKYNDFINSKTMLDSYFNYTSMDGLCGVEYINIIRMFGKDYKIYKIRD